MAPLTDIYYEFYRKTKSDVEKAQLEATRILLGVAVKMLYEAAADKRSMVNPTVHDEFGSEITLQNAKHKPCLTAEETLAALLDYSTERDCIRAFNQLAESNGFDLSLKSSGIKSEQSLRSKERRPKNSKIPRDPARLLVISDNLDVRTNMLRDIWVAVDRQNDPRTLGDRSDEATWGELTNTGVWKDTINKKLHGVPLEIQAVPRVQAAMATRISHRPFRTAQEGAVYLNPQNHFPTVNLEAFMEAYAGGGEGKKKKPGLQKVMNELLDPEELLRSGTLQSANRAFATDDMSSLTFDKVSEGGAKAESEKKLDRADGKPRYSPIFTFADLRDYRNYLLETVEKHPVFERYGVSLPDLSVPITEKQIGETTAKLDALAQITHVCYIREAPEETRTEYVAAAIAKNKLARKEIIPDILIQDVVKGVKGPAVDMAQVEALVQERMKLETSKTGARLR